MIRCSQEFSPRSLTLRVCASLLSFGLAGSAAADVHVVAASGGEFLGVQDALNVAKDGDVILVRLNVASDFIVFGAAVTIVADVGFNPVAGNIAIQDTVPGKDVVIIGFDTQPVGLPGVLLVNNAGSIRFEDCNFHGDAADYSSSNGYSGALIQNSSDVSFLGCSFNGGDGRQSELDCPGGPQVYGGGAGLHAIQSTVSTFDCTFTGGRGGDATGCRQAGRGGVGTHIGPQSECFFSGAEFRGGPGGVAASACDCGGDGGPGLSLGLNALGRTHDVQFLPGSPDPLSSSGASGANVQSSGSSTHVQLAGKSRRLTGPRVVRDGVNLNLSIAGEPGDAVFLVASDGAELSAFAPLHNGSVLLRFPLLRSRIFLGIVPAGGRLSVSLLAPAIPAGDEQRLLHLQVLTTDPSGANWLSNAKTLLTVDGSL